MDTQHSSFYRIRIANHLDADRADWFDDMQITYGGENEAETILSGYVRDQAHLYGLLNKLRNLNLTLVGVERRMTKDEC